ncbi:hypothetical protein LTR08_003825 [Meristemomyces frigidus]|nr:hypothetical protein LTR08_003825 [Meristemomyces frigidus]
MAEMHTYKLSSIDQSVVKTYIRYCLCYPCQDYEVLQVTKRLQAAVKRVVTHLPILAGTVHSVAGDGQRGCLEVSVSLNQVNTFAATTKDLHSNTHISTYQQLSAAAMPPSELVGDDFTPVPDTPSDSGPVFVVQGSFIRGGLIVALYLHHSVADISSLGTIMREMSSDLPSCKLTNDDLRHDALEQTRLRDRLSGSRGVKSVEHPEHTLSLTNEVSEVTQADSQRPCCCVVGFSLKIIEGTKEMINERFHYYHQGSPIRLTGFDVMAAILWKAISRASWQEEPVAEGQQSSLTIPVNIRNRIEPPLDNDFFGNAVVPADVHQAILRLRLPFELTDIQHTAWLIRTSMAAVTEPYVRSVIAAINAREDVVENVTPSHKSGSSLVITSWADLPLDEAELTLGIGRPEWGRTSGREHAASGCIVLPVKREQDLWESTVQLTEDVMERLLKDEGFMKFVNWVA